jgi:hypothetical protein
VSRLVKALWRDELWSRRRCFVFGPGSMMFDFGAFPYPSRELSFCASVA